MCCLLQRIHYVRIVGLCHQLCREVYHGYVVHRNPEGHAGELAVQLGYGLAHRLCGAGGGGDYVVEHGAAGAQVAAACPGVHRLLLGGGGMYGGHKPALYAEAVVHYLGKGR